MAEEKRTEEKPSETPIRIWLLNEKEAIEKLLKESGQDMFQQEVDNFVNRINNDKTQIYSRRSDIKGVGMIYAEGLKFADLLAEAIQGNNRNEMQMLPNARSAILPLGEYYYIRKFLLSPLLSFNT